MKNIGILAFGNKYGGGIYQYTHSLIDALKEDKTNKYIIYCYHDDDRFDNNNLEVRKIQKTKNNILKKVIRLFQLFFIIRKPYLFKHKELAYFDDIDIFISPSISDYPHFYLDKPFIFTLHDMQEKYYPNFFTIYERFLRWLNNRAISKSATKIICESAFVKKDIIKFLGINNKKIMVIQSPPPEELLNYKFDIEKSISVITKYNLPQKFLFYPAQCWYHKNHINLVRAFKKVSINYDKLFLVLTGSQQNNYDSLVKEIYRLNLSDKIMHLGYIDYQDLPYIYNSSLMLVMPSLFESVSIPIYEAFSLSVPVCSSNVVALNEQVGDNGLLFDPNNVDDIANKILYYLNDKKLLEDKATMGKNSIINFNHNNYKNKLLTIIREVSKISYEL